MPESIPAVITNPDALAKSMREARYRDNLDQYEGIRDPSRTPPSESAVGTSRSNSASSESPTTIPSASTPTADPFTPQVLAQAQNFGISPEEARAFGDVTNLNRAIAIAQRRAAPPPPQPTQQQLYQQQQAELQRQQEELSAYDYQELPDPGEVVFPQGHEYAGEPALSPEAAQVIRQRDQYYQGLLSQQAEQIQAIQQQMGQTAKTVAQQREEAANQEYDGLFAQAAEEYRPALGQGTYHSLSEHSPEFRARVDVVIAAEKLMEGFRQIGRNLPRSEAFQMALRATLGGQAVQQVERRVGDQLRAANGQFLARPRASSNASPAAPPSEGERDSWAVNRLATRMREAGWN